MATNMGLLNNIAKWPAQRWPWTVLAVSAFALEAAALFFQYVMDLDPCVMCVYQRVAVLGLFVSALPAMVVPGNLIARAVSAVGATVSAVWGFKIAYEHVQMQNPENFMLLLSCDVIPQFPSWLQLHKMIPAVFEPRGMCGDIDWSFLSLSMPQWMAVLFAAYAVTLIASFTLRLALTKRF